MSFWKKIIDAIDAFINKDTTRRTVTGTERKERNYPVAPYGACDMNFEYLRREGNSYYTTRKVPYCADRSFKTETVETVFEFAYKMTFGRAGAHREHEQKTKNYTKEKWAEVNDGMMAIFAEFDACKNSGASADSAEAQALVAKLQTHITANYYTCTDEILAGLGKMYVADERFKKNIDKHGEGTAEFSAEAINCFCNTR